MTPSWNSAGHPAALNPWFPLSMVASINGLAKPDNKLFLLRRDWPKSIESNGRSRIPEKTELKEKGGKETEKRRLKSSKRRYRRAKKIGE